MHVLTDSTCLHLRALLLLLKVYIHWEATYWLAADVVVSVVMVMRMVVGIIQVVIWL